jgi:hypothetical protein
MPSPFICGRYESTLPNPSQIPAQNVRVIREEASSNEPRRLRRKLARRFPWKSNLDPLFLCDPHQHWAEVFELEPQNGNILSVDFNSMYPYALLSTTFPHPARLQYHEDNFVPQILEGTLRQGIYACQLELNPSLLETDREWIRRHHYLHYTEAGRSHHFLWPKTGKVLTLLFPEDILALAPFFHIQTLWGIFDPQGGIPHPLTSEAKALLHQKLHGETQEDRALAKLQLVSLCSTQRRPKINHPTKNLQEWEQTFGSLTWENLRHYKKTTIALQKWQAPSPSAIYCLYGQIRAFARSRMLALAYSAHKLEAKLLRIHTDGAEFWCQNSEHQKLLQTSLSQTFSAGPDVGQLKFVPAQHGFFLGPNLTWTYDTTPSLIWKTVAGPNAKTPLNPLITLPDGREYNLLYQSEQTKFLRKRNGNYVWERSLPQNPLTFRQQRKRNTIGQKFRLFAKFHQKIHEHPLQD